MGIVTERVGSKALNRSLYSAWLRIRQRCLDANHPQFMNYGGRGIVVCPEWEASFTSFYDWAIKAGWEKGLQVDRINNNQGYSPDNCRVVTAKNINGVTTRERRPLYFIWIQMNKRCRSESHGQYLQYGGRGICVCEAWQSNFLSFYDWAIRTGWEKGLQVDRINNNKGYSPENCRIVTGKKNSNNRRSNRYCSIDGQKMSFAEAVDFLGVNRERIKQWDKGTGKVPKPENMIIFPPGYY
jgi:hypothetical protein